MALTVANVITRAADIIQDTTHVRWPDAELLRWLNDGRRELAVARPDVYSTTETVSLTAGTKQTVPAAGSRFLDAVRNRAGDTDGQAVRVVEREILDAQRPSWHTEAESSTIKHFCFDERAPKVFYVYPPASATAKLEIVYSRAPVDISDTATLLSDEDIYTGALVDYIVYRAFSKDAQYAANAQLAAAHYQQFATVLGIGKSITDSTSPNTANLGGMPPRPTAA